MAKKLWSIFGSLEQGEMKCYKTGATTGLERHHIFEGRMGLKKKSEKYGFIVPLHKSVHTNGVHLTDNDWVELDHELKRKCQKYYLKNYGNRDDWYEEFGRYYDYEL